MNVCLFIEQQISLKSASAQSESAARPQPREVPLPAGLAAPRQYSQRRLAAVAHAAHGAATQRSGGPRSRPHEPPPPPPRPTEAGRAGPALSKRSPPSPPQSRLWPPPGAPPCLSASRASLASLVVVPARMSAQSACRKSTLPAHAVSESAPTALVRARHDEGLCRATGICTDPTRPTRQGASRLASS